MDNNQSKEGATLAKLEQMLCDQSVTTYFDEDDVKTLRRVIQLVNGLDALGSFAGFIQKSVIWLGVIVGAFVAYKAGFIEFVASVVKATKG